MDKRKKSRIIVKNIKALDSLIDKGYKPSDIVLREEMYLLSVLHRIAAKKN